MAITQTGAMYKALSFDNTSSRNYGVYITGQAVYNAPERDVEMISIPGRNGSFALDKGRFENIEVTYPAGIFAETEADFAQAVSDFRNYLCSKKGYCRLSDEYNPNEYRMAVYKSGLEVDPAQLKAGQFNLTFECKPQRWLTSGETAVTVASGGTVTNPTLFESGPLLAVEGGGTITFNGYNIELENASYGNIELLSAGTGRLWETNISFNPNVAHAGDAITISSIKGSFAGADPTLTFTDETVTGSGFNYSYYLSADGTSGYIEITDVEIEVGTASNIEYRVRFRETGGPWDSIWIGVSYDGNGAINIKRRDGLPVSTYSDIWTPVILHSTKYYLDGTIYVDCDLGEAYKYEGGEPVSLNAYIDLGSDLPTLVVGTNTITYDNTFTSVKVTPRWWKI